MNFKTKITEYLKERGITVTKVEQEKDNESIVCHVPASQNEEIAVLKERMEEELDVAVAQSDMFGMNVVIVESNNLE